VQNHPPPPTSTRSSLLSPQYLLYLQTQFGISLFSLLFFPLRRSRSSSSSSLFTVWCLGLLLTHMHTKYIINNSTTPCITFHPLCSLHCTHNLLLLQCTHSYRNNNNAHVCSLTSSTSLHYCVMRERSLIACSTLM
jgi:hypothetical protein